MRQFDKFKVATHNAIQAKSRTFLTIIIVFIISALIMGLSVLGLNFVDNSSEIQKQYFSENGSTVNIYDYYYDNSTNGKIDISQRKMKEALNIIEEYVDITSSVKVDMYSSTYISTNNHQANVSVFSTIYSIPYNFGDSLLEGNVFTSNDVNTNKVIVTNNFISSYYSDFGVILSIGDEFSTEFHNYGSTNSTQVGVDFEIIGIADATKIMTTSQWGGISRYDIIADANYIMSQSNNILISNIEHSYNPPHMNFSFTEVYEIINSLNDEINDSLGSSFEHGIIENMKMANMMKYAIIGLIIFLSLIIIVLSVGSIANTVMISVDKNKRFIGLMKSLGLNGNDVKGLIKYEATISVFLGVFLATIALFGLQSILTDLNSVMIDNSFSYILESMTYENTFTLPMYLPIIVFIALILFAIFFARESLKGIAKMDAITVISEVS